MESSKEPTKLVHGEKQNIVILTPRNIAKSQSQQEQPKMNKDDTHYIQSPLDMGHGETKLEQS